MWNHIFYAHVSSWRTNYTCFCSLIPEKKAQCEISLRSHETSCRNIWRISSYFLTRGHVRFNPPNKYNSIMDITIISLHWYINEIKLAIHVTLQSLCLLSERESHLWLSSFSLSLSVSLFLPLSLSLYIYIYIERERGGEKRKEGWAWERERERERRKRL